jgi:DNA-binding Lrp family transcriptional regulator
MANMLNCKEKYQVGRPKKEIDETMILDMRSQGKSIKEIACDLGVSKATLSRRIAELKHDKGILTKYRELQGLQLTSLQCKIMEAITPERIAKASLLELVKAFWVVEKAQRAIKGKESYRIKGLLGLLMEMEEKFPSGEDHVKD